MQIVGTQLADEGRHRIPDRTRALAAHLVIGEQNTEYPHVVSRGLTLFRVAVQHLTGMWRHRCAVNVDMAKEFDRLRPAVFDDLELLFRQIGDRLALLIRDDHIDADDIDAGAKGGRATLRWRRATLRRRRILRAHQRRANEHQNKDDRQSEGAHGVQSNLISSFSCAAAACPSRGTPPRSWPTGGRTGSGTLYSITLPATTGVARPLIG